LSYFVVKPRRNSGGVLVMKQLIGGRCDMLLECQNLGGGFLREYLKVSLSERDLKILNFDENRDGKKQALILPGDDDHRIRG